MATPLICAVPILPTIRLSRRETKLVIKFWIMMGTATAIASR